MKRYALLLTVLLAFAPKITLAQTAAKGEYMQLFFVGSQWLTGHGVVLYSPAFKGKTEEVVAETEATRQLSPGAFKERMPTTTTPSSSQQETDSFERMTRLLEARNSLARAALSKALNEVAADGWEVVQMTSYGGQGGLVYLLKKR